MSQERRNKRGHDYYMDVFHRRGHLQQYVGPLRAQWMCQIDIDSCEYCHLCSEPVALIETKERGALVKAGTVTVRLAARAHLEAYLVEYEIGHRNVKCLTCAQPVERPDQHIVAFWVTSWSGPLPEQHQYAPLAFAEWLWSLRHEHWTVECSHPRATEMLSRFAGAA